MRGLFSSAHNIALDIREAVSKHWFNGIGGSSNGVYLLVPFTHLSMWFEWRDINVGFGHEAGPAQWEFFAGRLQGVFCIEPAAGQ
ncbi:hypothetical protein [Devosia psychrophila]|uniref:Uncharacterized protein n=1 Tax=Devosia psychrophila TaxID=728005 RepID=A0A0F5Q1U7_9HYPH|nr:hypothetical protein [Devosia psychrophila]KKC34850.1 hypothetical protein WH91_01095 [Devosia psychrophila]SFC10557.1 hypothetical protein SAMN04488059_102150 [Devosia psychrophila]